VPSVLEGVLLLGSVRIPVERLVAASIAMLLVALLYALVYRTRTGLAMRAIEEDEETARMLGVDTDRVAGIAVALGFALAALGGIFVAPIYSINPGMGLEAILMSFIIIIVGGLGSITGTVLAGLLIGIIQAVGSLALGAEAAHVLVFVAMIAMLVFRPQGLMGRIR
jgi:branched-chain amino acid transport system permease protein